MEVHVWQAFYFSNGVDYRSPNRFSNALAARRICKWFPSGF